MSLQIDDVENDPLVKETILVFQDAMTEKYKDDKFPPPERYMAGQFDNPLFRLLADTDCLDAVSAAVLASDHMVSWVGIDAVEPKLDPAVAEVMKTMHGDMGGDPEALLQSKNPLVFKLLVAAITQGITGEEFNEMATQAPPMELRMMVGEMMDMVTEIAEQITARKAWETLPPKLLDRYIEGLSNLAEVAPGKAQKRLMQMVVSDLKTDIAKAAAEELAAQMPPPVPLDPDSPFVKLKVNARKFKL